VGRKREKDYETTSRSRSGMGARADYILLILILALHLSGFSAHHQTMTSNLATVALTLRKAVLLVLEAMSNYSESGQMEARCSPKTGCGCEEVVG
jgi:hypothetical protein